MKSPQYIGSLLLSLIVMQPFALAAQPLTESVDALELLFGKHAGMRRTQAKGLCANGIFTGTAEGRALSKATAFSGAPLPAMVRFSVGGGNPRASDKSRSTRGLSLKLDLPDGSVWMQANLSAPVYFVKDPADFAPFVRARVPDPATGKPDPERLKAFNLAHPESLRQGKYLAERAAPASYVTTPYWGVNAFVFRSPDNQRRFVRWRFEPDAGEQRLSDEQGAKLPDNFLADELRQRLAKGPASFRFQVQLAEAEDDPNDATQSWPDQRRQVTAGRLVIHSLAEASSCEQVFFNPLALPDGIEPSSDPVLLARPAAYGISFGRRAAERQ
ncbi:MAG: catalase family peroxidase [Acidovorax sp.]|uniref:catalase family peroxidase n=1 Tax=Acidovorax sp. TaxID=1872122 RepID=UPI0022CC1771|nr:catalase family peroxidase [Acidovorax sp.]MCZ8221350.1 catalase family peroxidase [Acidovorax sp.]